MNLRYAIFSVICEEILLKWNSQEIQNGMNLLKTYNSFKGILKITILVINRKMLYKIQYFHCRGHLPDLVTPKNLSELVLAEMLEPSFGEKYADYADKVKVREYIKERGFEEILLKHYGVWRDARQIDFNKLPKKFVLKTNNGCGGYVFCRDKSMLDIGKAVTQINKTLRLPYIFNKEPQYKAIDPLIFCEELIDTGSENTPADYKFLCINGKPVFVLVYTGRNIRKRTCLFDMNWKVQASMIISERKPEQIPERPDGFDKMIQIAETLSEGFRFVRVDLYFHQKKIYFGELTFTPSGGIFRSLTDEALIELGQLYRNS